MGATAAPYEMHKRSISYVTDLPEDAYKEDDKVTIIIAATVGGIAGLVLLSSLIFAVVRRKRRGPVRAKDVALDESDEDEMDGQTLRQPRYITNMQEPQIDLFAQQTQYPSASQLAQRYSVRPQQAPAALAGFSASGPPPPAH
ncbi:hypothetical protein LPJ70_004673 [Coemansia sp. RSA 2708]|nr:hypothetical protein LPJ70_004673 [Coemansia sp. RSA 2708]